MPIDTSIYSSLKPVEIPDYQEMQQKAMTLRSLGLQQQQAQQAMDEQMAVKRAYAANVGEDGKLNRQGVLSDLAKEAPEAMQKLQEHFNKTDKDQADAQTSQAGAFQKRASIAANALTFVAKLPPAQQPQAYNMMRQHLVESGVASPGQLPDYTPQGLSDLALKAQQHMGQNSADYLENENKKSGTAKNWAETDKIRDELGKLQPITGQSDDPAKLVAGRVPKQHQAKALEEIKNAEDIRALTPKILTAFEMGSSRNPIVAAQGQREFEGLMNTTVKDQEGTARQAAFDSIHKAMTPSGLLASPGENEAKRRTVLEYLQSKTSAPTARAYGVDLAKFDSTAPFKPADKKTAEDGTAYAADAPKAPAQPPAGTIRMQAPDGSIRYVPASQKGEAIAAGGKVLK